MRSRYSKRGDKDIISHIEDMQHTLEKQKHYIDRLTSKNDVAKEKIKKMNTHNKSPPGHEALGHLKQTSLKKIMSTQLQENMVDSSEE